MTDVGDLVRQRARTSPRPAFFEGATGRSATWQQAAAAVSCWSQQPAGARLGLAIADPLAMATNFLGALGAGVPVAPLDPSAPAGELAAQARALGLAAVVTDRDVPGVERRPLSGPDAGWAPDPAGPLRTGGRRDDRSPASGLPGGAALIMASSGTTGRPKVIPLSDEQLIHTARGVARHLDLGPDQRGFSPLPLFHINGLVVGVLAAAVADSALVVDRRFSRSRFWDVVERYDVTWLNLVPAIIAVLATAAETPPAAVARRVRLARSASAPLAPAVRDRFQARYGIPVIETYGMTEAASQITANPVTAPRPGSVGLPVGVELRVVGDDGRSLPSGTVGHVQIRGASVVRQYWAEAGVEPAVRPASTPDGWLPTGDVGHLDADGYLYLAGRDDDVINRGGEKVQPREVEETLLADPRVQAAVVVGRPHPTVGAEPVAYVLAADGVRGHHQLAADLAERCAAALARSKRPAEIVVVDDLPAGPTGKVRRDAVRRLATATERPVEVAPR